MKITAVDLFEVEIPPIPPIAKYYPKIYEITLCRVQTDEGIQGWGEYQGTRTKHEATVQGYLQQDPLKFDPFMQPDFMTCALLDIAGHVYGLPLHRFFGPRVRDEVPVSYWSCPMEPSETAAEAEVGAGLGFTSHKL
ncbi:uncharacterized protein METZ01_LOCUS296105, partial [marine metagenome]